jgi:hypothetical protein
MRWGDPNLKINNYALNFFGTTAFFTRKAKD